MRTSIPPILDPLRVLLLPIPVQTRLTPHAGFPSADEMFLWPVEESIYQAAEDCRVRRDLSQTP